LGAEAQRLRRYFESLPQKQSFTTGNLVGSSWQISTQASVAKVEVVTLCRFDHDDRR